MLLEASIADLALALMFPCIALAAAIFGAVVLHDRAPIGGHVWPPFFAVLVLLVPGILLLLRWGERAFVAWGGLKGAVPILLAAFAILADADDAQRVYEIVFVVVGFSVVVQGASVSFVASRLGVPMRVVGR